MSEVVQSCINNSLLNSCRPLPFTSLNLPALLPPESVRADPRSLYSIIRKSSFLKRFDAPVVRTR